MVSHMYLFCVYRLVCFTAYIGTILDFSTFSLPSSLFQVNHTCSYDGEEVIAISDSVILGGSLQCGFVVNVLGIHGDIAVGSTDCKLSALTFLHYKTFTIRLYGPSISHADCHSSCKSCLRGNDSTACTSCNDDSLEVAGDPAGPCQPPGKKGSSSVTSTYKLAM